MSASAASSQQSATARANQVRCVSPITSTSGAVNDQLDQMASKNASTRSTSQSTRSPTTSADACAPTATSAPRPSGRKIQRIRPTRSATFHCTGRSYGLSERDVSVLALGDFLPLVAQHLQGAAELRPGVLGEDHLVHVSELGGLVRIRERVPVFLH